MAPVGCGRGRKLLHVGGCQVRHKEKKPKIGRDVEVEVNQGVHEKSCASHDSGELQGACKRRVILAETRKGLAQQNYEKPGTA